MSREFTGIFFNNDLWQVVPTTWLYKDKTTTKVWWPNEGNVTELAQKSARVGKDWEPSVVCRIATSSSEFLNILVILL